MTISIGTCLSDGWADFKKDPILHILATVLFGVVNGLTFGLLFGPLWVGHQRTILKQRRGESVSISDLFSGFENKTAIASILGGILIPAIVGFGYLCCIIPGIILAPLMTLGLYPITLGSDDGIAAIRTGWQQISANMVGLAIATSMIGFVGMIGVLACGIGLFVTLPIAFGALVTLAQQANDTTSPKLTDDVARQL